MATMMLGDAFNRRKKLAADLATWIHRLSQSGAERRMYRTATIEGEGAFVPEVGSDRSAKRHYTIEECRERIREISKEDRVLARRISLTNQSARAKVAELDLTIPELLVLKTDIIPKLEQIARAIPTVADNVNVFDSGEGFIRHRAIKKVEKKKETLTSEGHKVEEVEIIGYDVTEVKDYGIPQRDAWNEIDRIQEFAQRVKHAINQANKSELVDI
jgi:hypothetical protein